MICKPCSEQDHLLCPSAREDLPFGTKKPGTGLSKEGTALQLAALCTCQHRQFIPLSEIELQ